MGRATCYSARAIALMRLSVIEGARRVVVNGGTRVCRQRSHLSGRAAAWVKRNDRLRAVLGGSSMHVQPSCDEFERRLLPPSSVKLGQDIIVPQVGPVLPGTTCNL